MEYPHTLKDKVLESVKTNKYPKTYLMLNTRVCQSNKSRDLTTLPNLGIC